MMEKQNRLFEGLWRQTLTVMVMISLSKIGATTVDGIIMARAYGADASAAMGIAAPFGTFLSLIGGLISTGCQSICAGAYAKGDARTSNKTFVTSFYLAAAIAVLITAGALLLAEPVCAFMGAKGENAYLLPETAAYLRGVSVGSAAMVLNLLLAPVAQLYAGGKCVKRSILLLFLSDVVFDVLAVLLNMGSWGIGLSTALSNALCMFLMLAYLVSAKTNLRLTPRYFDRGVIAPILTQGMPEAIKRFFRMAGDIFANIIVLATATGAAMAGKTLGNLFACLFTTVGLGAASAMYLLSGAYIAMEDENGLVSLGKKQLRHLLITLALAVVSIALTPALVDLILKADAGTKRVAVVCVRCILLSMPVYVCFEMVTSYLQSLGHRKDANLISILGQTALYLPLVAVAGLRFGAVGVLLSSPLAMLLTLAFFYGKLSWKLGRPARLRDILHVSSCIRTEDIDVVARNTVQRIEDAVQCSEEVRLELLRKGADPRTALAVSLFVEEICSNIIEHGFRKSAAKKKRFFSDEKYAAIFAFIQDGAITLRIYDNCVLFDPAEKLKTLEAHEKDPERGLGLKLVFSMADEATYTSMLNMNHMLIRVPMHRSGAAQKAGNRELNCVDERFLPDALKG
jgi:Na+-driven multidrug efflux pump/anti-sigma regulatory factor (Ser/Thr protein kinase)